MNKDIERTIKLQSVNYLLGYSEMCPNKYDSKTYRAKAIVELSDMIHNDLITSEEFTNFIELIEKGHYIPTM